jgi:hypothetical protein
VAQAAALTAHGFAGSENLSGPESSHIFRKIRGWTQKRVEADSLRA